MIHIEKLNKFFKHSNGSDLQVFEDLSLKINRGEFVSIFGPNGCGKTTLLNLISGIDKDYSGKINSEKIKTAYIFQNYKEAVFPWLSVMDNVSYPLKIKGHTKSYYEKEVKELCEQFGIKFDLNSYPYLLSGGQQQLVSIVRAIITKPDLIIMDEPFSSLDYQTTIFLLNKIQEIWLKTNVTIVFVSHHIDESILLAQKIFLLSKKPTTVIKEFLNDEPYPRQMTFSGSQKFAQLKHEILSLFLEQIK